MNRFFLGCLAVCALALMIGQATANPTNNADNNGVLIIETYTASAVSVPNDSDMQPLPNDPGVEVAPVPTDNNQNTQQPVAEVEESVSVEQTESND